MTIWPARPGRARARGIVAVLLLLTATGCAGGGPVPAPLPGTQALVRSELYFGRLKPDGSVVTDAEWRTFVAEQVVPRFPDGFTVLDALGQYRGRDGKIIAEPTKVLLIVHRPDARPRASVQEVRDVYRQLFQQESVLLIENPARAGF
jgi:Protein of unknown function (DUF3574)